MRVSLEDGWRIYTNPIMACKHKMISTKALIPKWIFPSNNIDIVCHCLSNRTKIMRVADINIADQHCHTERKEKYVGFIRISGSELVIHLNLVYEIAFHGVYTLAGSIVKYGRLSFFVYKDFELSFHF